MEKLAAKILTMIDDLRLNTHDLDYLGWQLVYQSPKSMRKRIAILADAITYHINNEQQEEVHGQDALF